MTPLDLLFSHAYHPRILNDYLYRAMHTPPGLSCPTETERQLKMKRLKAVTLEFQEQNHSSAWEVVMVFGWDFQVDFKEIWSTMNASSVFHRQWEKLFI